MMVVCGDEYSHIRGLNENHEHEEKQAFTYQVAVADSMAQMAVDVLTPPSFIVSVGDNFYSV